MFELLELEILKIYTLPIQILEFILNNVRNSLKQHINECFKLCAL